MPRLVPSAALSPTPSSPVPACERRNGALDTALALDKRTVWPTHRIRGFLMSQRVTAGTAR